MSPEVGSVLVWNEGNGIELMVWITPGFGGRVGKIPDTFQGYPVKVTERPRMLAAK
jgi:hypothetical protein